MSNAVKLDITADASKAVAEIKRVDTALTQTAAAGESAGRKVGGGMKSLEESAGRAGQSSAKLRGALSLVSPELGNMAGFANDAADAVEVFAASESAAAIAGAALNPVVLATVAVLGLAAGAYYLVTSATEEHEAAVRANAAAIEAAAEVAVAARASIAGLGLEWQVATGQMSEATAAYTKGAADIDEKFAESLRLANTNVGTLKQQIDTLEAAAESSHGMVTYREQLEDLRPQLEAATKDYADLQGQVEHAKDQVSDIVISHEREKQATEDARKATEAASEAKRRAAERAREQAQAEAQLRAEMEAAAKVAQDYRDALASIEGAGRAAAESNLVGIEREQAARTHALEALADSYSKAQDAALGNDAAMLEADQAYATSKEQIIGASEDRIKSIRDKAAADEAKKLQDGVKATQDAENAKAQAVVSTLNQAFGVASQLFDLGVGYQTDLLRAMESDLRENEENMTEGQKKELKKRIEAQRDAAKRSFEIAKAAKIAEAIASTALAVINAISQSPPPSPFGLIGAGIAAAAGAISIAQIAGQEPSFHVGTSEVRRYSAQAPDEVRATLLEGEAVLSRRAVADMGGRTAIEDRNAGRRNGESVTGGRPAPIQYRHREFNEFIRDNIRLGGPLSTELNKGTRVGHRERSYT